jgi:DNA-directed RNA polymerase specialized sigma subunit
MLTLEEITIRLQDRKLKEVARRCDISYITVWRIAKRCAGNVSYVSVAKLSEYLEKPL